MTDYIDIAEFREFGYVQELNRRFLHPLGLALEVIVAPDGTERLGGVWDYRDDPEGISYEDDTDLAAKAQRVAAEMDARTHDRVKALGYLVQPTTASQGAAPTSGALPVNGPTNSGVTERVAQALNAEACRQRGLSDRTDWAELTEQERGGWRNMAAAAEVVLNQHHTPEEGR